MRTLKNMKGVSVAEMLVSVAIFATIASISVASFASFYRREALNAGASALAAGLRDARAQTLASVGGSQFGIKIEPTGFIFFKGANYSLSATSNMPFSFGSGIRASSSMSSIVFERVTGLSSASGTIDVYIATDPSKIKIIRVESTGLVNVE